MNLTNKVLADIKAHALAAYPEEACGIITARSRYVPQKNISEDPCNNFEMSPQVFLDHDVAAIVHSHPDGKNEPTATDMNNQILTAVPWGLLVVHADGTTTNPFFWGADVFTPPLLGRGFRHGPSGSDGKGDCYALIRDWYKAEKQIVLKEFPRDNSWWANGQNLYEDSICAGGFQTCAAGTARQIGDLALIAINSTVVNHAAIYIGDGLVLHHLAGRLSRREPAGRWAKMVKRWVRYGS